jgi:exosortase/archaeosortase family protein
MLLFLKSTNIRWIYRILFFVVGAVITYAINILRITYIFVIQLNGGNYQEFHDYYGPLISVLWITFYPLIIMGIEGLSASIRSRGEKKAFYSQTEGLSSKGDSEITHLCSD